MPLLEITAQMNRQREGSTLTAGETLILTGCIVNYLIGEFGFNLAEHTEVFPQDPSHVENSSNVIIDRDPRMVTLTIVAEVDAFPSAFTTWIEGEAAAIENTPVAMKVTKTDENGSKTVQSVNFREPQKGTNG